MNKKQSPKLSFANHKHLNSADAALYLSINEDTLHAWTADYGVKTKLIGHELYFEKASLDAMMFSQVQS